MTTRPATMHHARDRAAERHHVALSADDMAALVKICELRRAENGIEDDKSTHTVYWRWRVLPVVYCAATGTIVTVLPGEDI